MIYAKIGPKLDPLYLVSMVKDARMTPTYDKFYVGQLTMMTPSVGGDRGNEGGNDGGGITVAVFIHGGDSGDGINIGGNGRDGGGDGRGSS